MNPPQCSPYGRETGGARQDAGGGKGLKVLDLGCGDGITALPERGLASTCLARTSRAIKGHGVDVGVNSFSLQPERPQLTAHKSYSRPPLIVGSRCSPAALSGQMQTRRVGPRCDGVGGSERELVGQHDVARTGVEQLLADV